MLSGVYWKCHMKNLIKNQQEKAQLYFAAIVFINLAILCTVITGIAMGLRGYISDTKYAYQYVTCCDSICLKCFFTLHTLFMLVPWGCIAILFVGICMAIYKMLSILLLSYTFTRSLTSPLSLNYNPKLKNILSSIRLYNHVVLLDNSNLRCAFTSGLWKPKIYLSTGICSYLTTKELLAVILHEIHHKNNKVPLKLFIIQVLHALNFFLPINPYLLNIFSSASEKAADDNAINFSREPLELASALVKLSKSNAVNIISPPVSFYRGHEIVEDRIRRLVGHQTIPSHFGNTLSFLKKEARLCLSCFLSLFITLTICLSLFYKPVLSAHTMDCKTKTCHMIKCG